MGSRLRRVEEGADTMLWLAVTQQAVQQPSGSFWQDRRCGDHCTAPLHCVAGRLPPTSLWPGPGPPSGRLLSWSHISTP